MIKYTLLLAVLCLVSGCASNNLKVSEAALSGDPAAQASEGARLNTEGAKLISEAEKQLAKGRKQVLDGEKMVRTGSDKAASARTLSLIHI